MREGIIPGWERYRIVIDDDSVRCINTDRGKALMNRFEYNGIYWRLTINKKTTYLLAERFIQMTFPGIERRDYIYQLYKGVSNEPCDNIRTNYINDQVFLEQLYSPGSYCLTTPIEINLRKTIKKMFPGPFIEIEKGDCDCRRRELYFRTDDHINIASQKLIDFFEDNRIFSNNEIFIEKEML